MEEYHGKQVSGIEHKLRVAQISSGSWNWTNMSGKTQYIQMFSISASSGTPTVLILVNGEYWTGLQQGTPSGIADGPQSVTLNATLSFQASTESQEIELPPQAKIEVIDVSGAGTITISMLIAFGRD